MKDIVARIVCGDFVFGPCFVICNLICVLSSFAIISLRKRELVALLYVLAAVWLLVFCVSSLGSLWSVNLPFPGHTHLLLL